MTVALLRSDGATVEGGRWLAPVAEGEDRALSYALSPALDVGCGPGRHTVELASRGIAALGIDITPDALAIARARGATVLERCVFDHLPRAGQWASALLLDGNIAIGGEPVRLLSRLRDLLRPGGAIVIEFNPDEEHTHGANDVASEARARLRCDDRLGPWFAWRAVRARDATLLAAGAQLDLHAEWVECGRAFAVMVRP